MHHHQRTHVTPKKHKKRTKHSKRISSTEKENHIGWVRFYWKRSNWRKWEKDEEMEGNWKHMFLIKQKEKQSMGLLCFFHRNQTKQTRFLWKKHSMGKMGLGLLFMGLVCLVSGKNAGVLVFCVWVAWRIGGLVGKETGPKGAFSLMKEWWFFEFAVIATVVKRRNGDYLEFAVFVYGSVFGFCEKFWVCCGWFFPGVWVCCGWMGCLPRGLGLHRAWEHGLQ